MSQPTRPFHQPTLDLNGLDGPIAASSTFERVRSAQAPARSLLAARSSTPMTTGAPLMVPLDALFEDSANPRTEFPEPELEELAADIRQHGILQPIVVHPVDAAGRWCIHFGAKRFRAARRAGLSQVPVVVRSTAADPYAQVAENQKRHGLAPMDMARFIRSRVALGESNATIADRLGMDLTSVAHHLSLLDLPPPLESALRSGRCTAPRTLHELSKLHAERPDAVVALLQSDRPITREAVAGLRQPQPKTRTSSRKPLKGTAAAKDVTVSQRPTKPVARRATPDELIVRADRLCTQLASTCSLLRGTSLDQAPAEPLAALRARLEGLHVLLAP